MSSFSGQARPKTAPVIVKSGGNFLKLYFEDSKNYAGIVRQRSLCNLLQKHRVHLAGTLGSTPEKSESHAKKTAAKRPENCDVRIVVCGLEEEKDNVDQALSEGQLFLQQPSAAECPVHLKYYNPQYLLPPGSEMPALESLDLETDSQDSQTSEKMDQVGMARLLRIFEMNTSQSSISSNPSPRLSSSLMP